MTDPRLARGRCYIRRFDLTTVMYRVMEDPDGKGSAPIVSLLGQRGGMVTLSAFPSSPHFPCLLDTEIDPARFDRALRIAYGILRLDELINNK